MHKKIWTLLIACAVLSASCKHKKKSLKEVFQNISTEVLKNSRAYETLKEASEKIGHRLTGTQNGKRAEEYAYNFFKKYGYEDVKYHEFEATSWMRENVSLECIINSVGSLGEEIYKVNPAVVSLAHSPVEADVKGQVIDVGNGLRKNFEAVKEKVKGKIILVNIGLFNEDSTVKNLHRSEKTALAIEYGAVGAIFINKEKGNILLTGTASVTGELIPIPAVCISYEDGKMLRYRMRNYAKMNAHIQMRNRSEKIKARNVIATIKGLELPDEKIIIGGHLDSWDLATGAIDNGIGSFTVMEIARVFKKLHLKPKRTIEFVMFMGEEEGLLGSTALVNDMIKDGSINNLRYMLNLDMAGNTIGFNIMGRKKMQTFIDSVGKIVVQIDTLFKNKISVDAGLHSDHQMFMLEGVPILQTESNLDPEVYRYYHSNKDSFNLVNKDHMNNCARFTAMLLYALADTDKIPAKKLDSEETKNFLIQSNLREELILGKKWKWGQ